MHFDVHNFVAINFMQVLFFLLDNTTVAVLAVLSVTMIIYLLVHLILNVVCYTSSEVI